MNIAKQLRELMLKFEYVIGGSYPMRSIREPSDIDVFVPAGDLDEIGKHLNVEPEITDKGDRKIVLMDGAVEIFETSWPEGFSYDSLKDEGFDQDTWGNPTWTLDQMKRWKQAAGRPKDIEHLKLINT